MFESAEQTARRGCWPCGEETERHLLLQQGYIMVWSSRCTRKLWKCKRVKLLMFREWRNLEWSLPHSYENWKISLYEKWSIQIWFYSRLSGTWGEVGLRPPYPPFQVLNLRGLTLLMANYSNWLACYLSSICPNSYASHLAHRVQQG